ncbi:MAG: isoprenylcysteine carboxylmethyltransferase family protein [Devosia sp.]
MSSDLAVALLWVAWLVSWQVAARRARKAVTRPPIEQERPYLLLIGFGAVLVLVSFRPFASWVLFGIPAPAVQWVLVALAALGFAFTWWARIHLGVLWSGSVTRKPGHRVVDSGPYALVRHPIYSGSLVALCSTALLRPGLVSFAGVGLFAVAFIIKARLEEEFLSVDLGAEYAAYRRRVPMLVPFWPPGR